ncbi:MAG: hypothetical protein LBD60_03345, partial [Puniceicoccales bacterium]|nr:hypothetical protein [Puniceicoccales bacterium]
MYRLYSESTASGSHKGSSCAGALQFFEHFTLRDSTEANADIYFPTDGHQPTTPEAAQWSCANVEANNVNSPITRWYVNAFFTYDFGFAASAAPQAPGQIVVLIGGTPAERMSFMGMFRTIAANPAGRVLLYRLLIEIRRQNAANNGCCEQGIFMSSGDLSKRNL